MLTVITLGQAAGAVRHRFGSASRCYVGHILMSEEVRNSQRDASLFVADVLLHECIHQYQHEVLEIERSNSYVSHGPTFRDMANEIGQKMGLPPVRASKRRGKDQDLPSCSFWPHCVRPDGYYQGAYIPGVRDSRAKAAVSLDQELRRLLRRWSKQEILDVLRDL